MSEKQENEKEVEKPIVAKTAVDLQRLKLMKLMKNPDKPVIIPERPKQKNNPSAPEFVRNVMGSSAGAGSGEFHVYRHLRRKEYSRQKFIKEKGRKELLDEEYHQKLEDNKRKAEETTSKKRAKRLKKKQKQMENKKMRRDPKDETKNENTNESDSENGDSGADEEKDDAVSSNNGKVAQKNERISRDNSSENSEIKAKEDLENSNSDN